MKFAPAWQTPRLGSVQGDAAQGSATTQTPARAPSSAAAAGPSRFLAAEVAQGDRPDLSAARIVVSGGFTADRINAFEDAGVPVDSYGVGTQVVTGSGSPAAGLVYKLVAREGPDGAMEGVAKVSTDKASHLGVNWALFSDEDGTTVPAGGFISPIAGASIANIASLVANPEAFLSGGGQVPNGTTVGVGRIRENGLSIAAVIRALRTATDSNVIAQPQILALDNQEVVISDGQQVPFLSGFTSSLGAVGGGGAQNPGFGLNPIQNIDRQQIGTTLTITPQINDGGTMTLDIALESSELAGLTGDAGSQITNNRELNTKVRVENGQTIVLGGMVRNSASRSETRVPFLGRIPIIGELFKTRGGENRQRMLMVFIRPTVLNDSTQISNATRTKYNLIRDEQIRQGGRREVLPLLPGTAQPELPEFEDVPNPIQPAPAGGGTGATTSPVP